MAWNKIRV